MGASLPGTVDLLGRLRVSIQQRRLPWVAPARGSQQPGPPPRCSRQPAVGSDCSGSRGAEQAPPRQRGGGGRGGGGDGAGRQSSTPGSGWFLGSSQKDLRGDQRSSIPAKPLGAAGTAPPPEQRDPGSRRPGWMMLPYPEVKPNPLQSANLCSRVFFW